ncbi:efflux RND transporter periplasmic adaptor subunit [Paenibacillus donghaensis]|uniref:HlyD family efflux transporter periplasmic adaptor subunit n=1 Tax=Paenibacillus donghaensis TaxID=414771 RepID=A0A2Z2K6Z7_9BACL|nr:HlyD family efflux transporter periplasmic adaptor subunit [Paenibacillus donghaensis]ASA20697.1 hypothetical protein B9T62_07780 [Paenibacillus donghaensis]
MNYQKKLKRKVVIPIITIIILSVFGYFAFATNGRQEETMPLREYKVFRGDLTAGIVGDGNLTLPYISHYFDVPVQLEAVYIKKGDTVKTGDRIAKTVGNDLKDPYLYAKLDGIVISVPSVEGEMTAGKPIVAQIGDPQKIAAQIKLSQSDIGEAEIGQLVQFTLGAYPTQTLQGKITHVQLAPTNANPLEYTVYASVEADNLLLLEGMTFSAQLIQKQVKNVLCLSNKAIQLKEGKQTVLLLDEKGNLFDREIQTGFSDGRYSEILEGLSEGDIVYLEG